MWHSSRRLDRRPPHDRSDTYQTPVGLLSPGPGPRARALGPGPWALGPGPVPPGPRDAPGLGPGWVN